MLVGTIERGLNGLPYMFINLFGRVGVIEIYLITKARDLPSALVRRYIALVGWEIRDGQTGSKYPRVNDTKSTHRMIRITHAINALIRFGFHNANLHAIAAPQS